MRDDDPQAVLKSDHLKAAPTDPGPPKQIDGGWFRRERERLAISRRTVSSHLRIPESRIITLERKKLPVPLSWLPLVAPLGFRSPGEVPSTEPASLAQPIKQASNRSPDPPPPSFQAVSPGEAVATEPNPPTQPPQDEAARAVPAPPIQAEHRASEPAPPPPLPDQPRGSWLRERRDALGFLLPRTGKAVQASVDEVRTVESHNLPVPPGWLPGLRALRFFEAPESAGVTAQSRLLTGDWLQRQRHEKSISASALSAHLGIRESLLRRIEARRWPLPPEWLPILQKLEFAVSQTIRPAAATVKRAAHPASPAHIPQPSRLTQISGAWIRRHREQLGLTQKALSERLCVDQSTLCHLEREDRPIKPQWLSTLKKLGFPVHADEAPPPTAKKAATPGPSQQARATQKPLSGAWLRRHRERLGMMQKTLSEHLRTSQSELCHREREDRAIPARWLPILTKLGFPVPAQTSPLTSDAKLTGAWLRLHRQRLRLFIRHLCDQLSISPKALRLTEDRDAPLPPEWLPIMKKLGFPVPARVALPSTPGAKSPAAPASRFPEGAWLRAERERLGISREQLARRLHKKEVTLRPVENGLSPLPRGWLPTLKRLGFRLPSLVPRAKKPEPAAPAVKSTVSKQPAQKPALAAQLPTAGSGSHSTSLPGTAERRAMAETVVSYRLTLGRFSGQSVAELLTSIGNDLRQAGLEKAIPFEEIVTALSTLLGPRNPASG